MAQCRADDYSHGMEMESEHGGGNISEWPAVEPGWILPGATAELTKARARIWALVLDARSVPCVLEQHAGSWEIHVPAERAEQACFELRSYEEQNRGWPPPLPPPRPLVENTLATISVLILLATFHNITRLDTILPDGSRLDWIEIGNAQAARILAGEWWRLITALTLHSDAAHLLGNLAIGGIFVFLLCRELGSGVAWSLILLSGALGNLVNAWFQPAQHSSVGGSTAVFGAVGILAALSMVRYRGYLQQRWPLPVASAIALLAILGTEGKNTDLGAHLFGFTCGIILGLVTERLIGRYGHPGRSLNILLALLSGVIVATAWWAGIAVAG